MSHDSLLSGEPLGEVEAGDRAAGPGIQVVRGFIPLVCGGGEESRSRTATTPWTWQTWLTIPA